MSEQTQEPMEEILDARFVSQSVPLSVAAGRPIDVAVTVQNIGNTTWTAPGMFRLGAQNPQDNSTWGAGRVYLPAGDTVAPGQHYTFHFTVRPPQQPGVFPFQWKMLKEHVRWFGDATPSISVRVTARSRLSTRMENLCNRWEQRADQMFAKVSKDLSPVVAALNGEPQSNADIPRTRLTDKIDAIFASYDKPGSPGLALAFMEEGEVIYKRGFGLANLETGAPITPSTVFHLASLSKQFVAISVLLLAEAGKLSLDDDIRKHVPELPDFGATVTIRHLLHHTSGLRDQWHMISPVAWRTDLLGISDETLDFRVARSDFAPVPGREYNHANTNYYILETIIRRTSGKSLRRYAHDAVFKPLGMSSTFFSYDPTLVIRNRATAYDAHPDGEGHRLFPTSFTPPVEYSLYSTVEDLARWDRNFYTGQVGGESVISKLVTNGTLSNGNKVEYACGIVVRTFKGTKTHEHGGHDQGFRSFFIRLPDRKFSIALLSNLVTVTPSNLALQVAEVVLNARKVQSRPGANAADSTAKTAESKSTATASAAV